MKPTDTSAMNLLALDFSTERRAVCVSTGTGKESVVVTTDRAAGPLGLIVAALEEAGLSRDQIELIAIGLGPGSYTGIRSSIAIAQGMQLGNNVKLVGISSADVVAHSTTVEGEFAVAIDAQRGEFYCAEYRRDGASVENISPLRIVSPDELHLLQCPIIGPDVERLLGQGTNTFPEPASMSRLAQQAENHSEGHELEPIYLRPPEFKKAPPARQIV